MATAADDMVVNGGESGEVKTVKEPKPSATSTGSGSKTSGKPEAVLYLPNGREESRILFPGDIIIKAQLEDDIRCINYNNQELTFVDLLKLLERMFKKAIKTTDDLTIKYKDADGDYVTLEDNDDVGFAIRTCGGLNVKIIRNSKTSEDTTATPSQWRLELLEIRDRVNRLLDVLDGNELTNFVPSAPTLSKFNLKEVSSIPFVKDPPVIPITLNKPTQTKETSLASSAETTEFDPLTGVSSSDDKRTDAGLTEIAGGTSALQNQAQPSASSTEVKQVIDSFHATARDTHSYGVSSNLTNRRTGQQDEQPPQHNQPQTSSLFDGGRGAAVKPEKNSNYFPLPNQSGPSQYPAVSAPTQNSSGSSMQTTYTAYGQAPATSGIGMSPYGSTNTNQYQSYSSSAYGATTASYGQSPNPVPTSSVDGYNYSGQARAQIGVSPSMPPVGQQSHASPMPSSPASAMMSGYTPQPSASLYGQNPIQGPASIGLNSQQGPGSMGVQQSLPPTASQQTQPPLGGMQQTALGVQQVQPQMGGPQAPPPMGVQQVPPQMGGPQAPPPMGVQQVPPQMGGQQVPPQMGGQQVPPQMGGQQVPPQMGGQQVPPQMGGPPAGPPPMSSAFRPVGPPPTGAGASANPYSRTATGSDSDK